MEANEAKRVINESMIRFIVEDGEIRENVFGKIFATTKVKKLVDISQSIGEKLYKPIQP